jgi:hypothetical protein
MANLSETEQAAQVGPQLSIVAVSRNDDHGGNMLGRMQYFVDGFIAQCRRHRLNAELILVEWNPPPDRPPLEDALAWPAEFGSAEVRIVTVRPEIHARFDHSAELPLFQMIGKNVGIRRARGQYVLATNIDILLDDDLVRYLRDELRPGTMLRVDRYDVPADLPKDRPFEQVLVDCRNRFYRVNTRYGIFDVAERLLRGMSTGLEAAIMSFVCGIPILAIRHCKPDRGWGRTIAGYIAIAVSIFSALIRHAVRIMIRYVRNVVPFTRLPIRSYYLLRRIVVDIAFFLKRLFRLAGGALRSLTDFLGLATMTDSASLRFRRSRWLHTWACGDFTLLARDDWFRLRGYPEWPIYSWHIDSALMYAANSQGLREVALGTKYRIYHIDHSSGSGWSPQGAAQLFARLSMKGIPYLSDDRLANWQWRVAEDPKSAIVNNEDWGLGDQNLKERYILPRGRSASSKNPLATSSAYAGT